MTDLSYFEIDLEVPRECERADAFSVLEELMTRMTDGMKWFKNNFVAAIAQAAENTPFTLDFLTAIAVQESFEIWGNIFDFLRPKGFSNYVLGTPLMGRAGRRFRPASLRSCPYLVVKRYLPWPGRSLKP